MNESTNPLPSPLRLRVLFSGVVLGFLLLLLEGGLRLVGHLPALQPDPEAVSANGYFWICDPALGFRNRPAGRYVYRDIRSRPTSTTDRLGFRNGYGWDPDKSTPSVVMVGDSVTFCAEVEDDQTTASHLARLLDDRSGTVLNAGVRGYNTVQAKRMLAECLDRYPSLRVAIYSYCDNDWFENIRPREYWPAQAPTVDVDQQTGRFIEVDVTSPTVPWGEGFLSTTEDQRAERRQRLAGKRLDQRIRDRLRERSALFHLALSAIRRDHSRPGGGAAEGGVSAGRAYPDVEYGGRVMVHLLGEMRNLCERRGVRLMVTEMRIGEGRSRIDEWCAAADVPFVDPSAAFRGPARRYLARLREGGYDPHLGPRGAEVFAAALFPAVERELRKGEGESGTQELRKGEG